MKNFTGAHLKGYANLEVLVIIQAYATELCVSAAHNKKSGENLEKRHIWSLNQFSISRVDSLLRGVYLTIDDVTEKTRVGNSSKKIHKFSKIFSS